MNRLYEDNIIGIMGALDTLFGRITEFESDTDIYNNEEDVNIVADVPYVEVTE